MIRYFLFLVLALFLFAASSLAQSDTLWLLNGQQKAFQSITIKEVEGSKWIKTSSLKNKIKIYEGEDVFAVVSAGQKTLIYDNSNDTNQFSNTQMEAYMQGKWAGLSHAPTYKPMILGGITGLTAPLVFPLFTSLVFSPIAPAIHAGLSGYIKTKPQLQSIPTGKATEPHYLLGYEEGLRKKRLNRTLLGGGIGLVVGIGLGALIYGGF